MKIILSPIIIIATSFFFFPFYFTFLPSINTKMMMAALGLLLLFFNMGRNRNGKISRDFFIISLCALGVSFASLLTMTYNDTQDAAYLSYIITMWVWAGAAYFVVNLIRAVHGKVNVELICFYMIAVGALQCLIAITMDIYYPLKNFVDSFLWGEGFMGKAVKGRLYGVGCALDVAGGRFAVLLIMIAFLLPRMYERKNSQWYFFFLLLSFCVIAVIGNMIGRTTSVGLIMALVCWIYMLCTNGFISGKNKKILMKWIFLFIAIAVIVSVILYNISDFWYKYFRFGFEGFFSLIEKGHWEVQSNEMLKEGLIFPDTFKTWIIGDGYMGAMDEDPYYIGEMWYGFYMGTDAGYSRFLFYFGLIGLGAFIVFIAKVCQVCAKNSMQYKYMFIAMLLLNLAIWIKVSTDIFLAFAPFLCLSIQDSKIEVQSKKE